jgi:hypothetical protein
MDDTLTLVIFANALIWGHVLGGLIYLALTSDRVRELTDRLRKWRYRNRPVFHPAIFTAETFQALIELRNTH